MAMLLYCSVLSPRDRRGPDWTSQIWELIVKGVIEALNIAMNSKKIYMQNSQKWCILYPNSSSQAPSYRTPCAMGTEKLDLNGLLWKFNHSQITPCRQYRHIPCLSASTLRGSVQAPSRFLISALEAPKLKGPGAMLPVGSTLVLTLLCRNTGTHLPI